MLKKWLMIGLSIVLLVSLGEVIGCSQSPAEEAPSPAPTTPNDSSGNHIIPMQEPEPEVEAEKHEYVYNPVEYYIAATAERYGVDTAATLYLHLKEQGYSISKEKIAAFRKDHRLKTGDIVLVRGKLSAVGFGGFSPNEGVQVASFTIGDPVSVFIQVNTPKPQWFSDAEKRFRAGEEVVATVRGTVKDSSMIMNCELVE